LPSASPKKTAGPISISVDEPSEMSSTFINITNHQTETQNIKIVSTSKPNISCASKLPANIVLKPPGLVAECILSKFGQSNKYLDDGFLNPCSLPVFVSLFCSFLSASSSALRGVPTEQRCPGYRNNQCPQNPMFAKAQFCARPVGKKEAEEVECGDEEEEVVEEVEN
jgi:hypothetical protein